MKAKTEVQDAVSAQREIVVRNSLAELGTCPMCGSEEIEHRAGGDLEGFCRDCKEFFEVRPEGGMITIQISTDNAAFSGDPGAEVARILRLVAEKADVGTGDMATFMEHMNGLPILDMNGNRAGQVKAE